MKLQIPDTSIYMTGKEMTADDHMALAELVQSVGWKVFKEKVCAVRLEILERDALTLPDHLDIRYRQGGFQEIWSVLRNAEEIAKKQMKEPVQEVAEDDYAWHGYKE